MSRLHKLNSDLMRKVWRRYIMPKLPGAAAINLIFTDFCGPLF